MMKVLRVFLASFALISCTEQTDASSKRTGDAVQKESETSTNNENHSSLKAENEFFSKWPDAKFTHVIGFLYNNPYEPGSGLIQNGRLLSDLLEKHKSTQTQLSGEQVSRLVTAAFFSDSKHPHSACYEPHHIFVFFDAEKPVAAIEVCFECLNIHSWPYFQAAFPPDFFALARLSGELKLGVGPSGESVEHYLQDLERLNER